MSIIATIKKRLKKFVLKLVPNGKLRVIANREEVKTKVLKEEISTTIKSLLTGSEEYHLKGIDKLTPKALIFITRLDKGQFANAKLKELYNNLKTEIIAKFEEANGLARAQMIFEQLEKDWKLLLSKKDRFLYVSQLYDMVFLPTFKKAGEVIPVPLFDSFIMENIIDYIAFYTQAMNDKNDKNKKAEFVKKAETEFSKMQTKARQFLSSNKLHAFIDGLFKAHFNVLAPFTHGAYKVNEILVPASSGFKIGDKVAGLRHPVMTGVVIFTVVGYTPDHTIKIDEVHFRRFQADSDGDFFLISDLIYYLISGKR